MRVPKQSFFFIVLLISLVVPVSASVVIGESSSSDGGVAIVIPEVPALTNVTNSTVNVSEIWRTNIGDLDNANSTQFENNGGTLSLIWSWLTGELDGLYLLLDASNDPITGNLKINASLNVTGNANFEENVTFKEYVFFNADKDHWIRINSSSKFDDIAGEAFWLHQDDPVGAGEILFLISHLNETNAWYQSGRNESFSGHGNSQGIIPNYWGGENFTQNGIVNMSQLSNYPFLCEFFDMGCVFTADTRGRGGPLLFTTGDLEVWKQTHLMEGVTSRGAAEFIMNSFDFNIVNGSLHLQTPRIQLVGFVVGDNVTIVNANFNADVLSPFAQTTSGGGASEWIPISDPACHSDLCARALGGAGSPTRGMSTSFSSSNLDNLNLTFFITTNIAGSDSFTITANNNVGSGEVSIFTTSTSLVDVFQTFILPSSMDDQSAVTLTLEFSGNSPIFDSVFMDNILVIGNATATTEANITVQDSEIKFGDGTGDGITYRGHEAVGFSIMNFTADVINFIGNVTMIDVVEVTLNITDSITVQNNITFASGATLWSNATCTFISSPAGTTVLEVCD